MEILFCTDGAIGIGPCRDDSLFAVVVSSSATSGCISIHPPFSGILIKADLNSLISCSPYLLGSDAIPSIEELFKNNNSILPVKNSLWSRSVSAFLSGLSPNEKCSYLSFKSAELIYMLIKEPIFSPPPCMPDNYITRTVASMHDYMENNLGEKITIESLSRKFNIAPTAFKETFRRLYGISVHKWLQGRRIEHSCRLLRSTSLSVLQIAHQVGYESTSQFNLAFRKSCGTSPGKYRKMSEIAEFRPF